MTSIYPQQVCNDCGNKAQRDKSKIFTVSTYNMGLCDVCGKDKAVTQPRDFGYPHFESSVRGNKS